MTESAQPDGQAALHEDFEDFFEGSLFGLATASPTGTIIRANSTLAGWLGYATAEMAGLGFSSILTMGGKIFYETHLAPLLRMQGYFDEIALELRTQDGAKLPVFVNAKERLDDAGNPLFIRLAIFRAKDRHQYEQNLRRSKADAEGGLSTAQNSLANERAVSGVREQFIAVLGHDLRNPLAAIQGSLTLLSRLTLDERAQQIIRTADKSAIRMSDLIRDVMDFARGRLGSGISLNRELVNLEPVLSHVVQELKTAWPGRKIDAVFDLARPVNCDPARLSQLLSNLLANAITHGSEVGPITVRAKNNPDGFIMSVHNSGRPIPAEALEKLFEPFTREDVRPSQQGLGLGLFIAAEIARAHRAKLYALSDDRETAFTFEMR